MHDDFDGIKMRVIFRPNIHAATKSQHLNIVVAKGLNSCIGRASPICCFGIRKISGSITGHVGRVFRGLLAVHGDLDDFAIEAVKDRDFCDQFGTVLTILDDIVLLILSVSKKRQ